ncbi:MAG: AAA family ATPase [Acidobacteria bacterium]|jgi:hypothetical protein|nr:AAA family ATPase [Acidobacteriota bacterium]
MADLKLNDILSLLKNVRQTSNGYTSRCPSHDDNKNSLSVNKDAGGKVLFYCHAGCSFQDIIASLNVSTNGNGNHSKIETIYDYRDESGNLLYQNVRCEGKEFRWRQFDKNGREIWNLSGVRRVPYRLAELASLPAHYDFVLAEGEKDADTLREKGLIATNHKNWRAEFNYLLKGRKAVVFQDHDRAGITQAEKAAKMIFRDAEAVKIVDCFAGEPLPDKRGKDVSDYLETHGFDELLEVIRNSPDWKPLDNEEISSQCSATNLKVVCLSDVEAEEIEWLWKPFIPIGEFTIIEGIEGLGKSWIGCALACAVADGKSLPFSNGEPLEPGNVLMLSAEDSLSHTVKPRLLSMRANLERIFAIDEVFSFSDFKDLIRFEAVIAEYEPKLVVIDPLFSYTGGKNLNQESESRPIARKLIAIAQKFNCAIGGVRHIGKSKGNGDARAAGLGSVAWRASARSVLLVGRDEETGEKAICQTKNNLAEESKIAVGFEIENGQFFWKAEPSRLTKEKMLAQPKDDNTKAEQTEAVAFLREALSDGERQSKDIDKEAKEAGITNYAVRKARAILSVESFKKGGNFGGEKVWFMRLPGVENGDSNTEDADSSASRHLQSTKSNNTSYSNSLAEDVENVFNQPLQQIKSTSSNGLVPNIRMKAICKCGANGFAGETCVKCGEMLIPF